MVVSIKHPPSLYEKIYEIVAQIPYGKVTTYGKIAKMVGGCNPRTVGYAMAATPVTSDIPWQRVINWEGKISIRRDGEESHLQRQLLEAEGVVFNHKRQVDLHKFGWKEADL